MISAGVEGRIPYMTYPDPWRGPPKQPPEFLRPAPKPLPSTTRYNGMTNGTRLAPPPHRPTSKYASPPAVAPVNLTQQQQHKEDISEELPYSHYTRLYHPGTFSPYSTTSAPYLYQSPYTPLLRTGYVQQQQQPPPLSPLETYATPTTPTSGTYLSPQAASTFSPPSASAVKPGQSVLRERKQHHASFKVPSGKEGSLKHRILTRPEDASTSLSSTSTAPHSPLDLQRDHRKQHRPPPLLSSTSTSTSATSPPRSPATNKHLNHHLNHQMNHHHNHHHQQQQQQQHQNNNSNNNNNNNVVQVKFSKGSLIQLASGDYKRIEDMRTEDFVLSAEKSEDLRLADSTVVKIVENPITGTATITLSYNQRRTQVDVESSLDHPFFVYGQGWASCSKDRTLQSYGLKVHTLQVGDILISLTPKESAGPDTTKPRSETIITTATTTSMTVRPVSARDHHHLNQQQQQQQQQNHLHQQQQQHLHHQHHQHLVNNLIKEQKQHQPSPPPPSSSSQQAPPLSPDRKRRWSAPDQISDGEPEARISRLD